MIESQRTSTRRWWIAAVVLTLSGCASSGPWEKPTDAPRPDFGAFTLFGVAGDRFVGIDPRSGVATELASSADLWEVAALTYDPSSGTFYAVAHAASDPELIAIDGASGETRKIGPIDLPTLDLTLVEGLAWDPIDGVLYATGNRSTFASERLLKVDPATGKAAMVGYVRGTAQNDVDALVAIAGKLYGVDVAGSSGAVYEIDKRTAQASLQPRRFPRPVTDLAFDPDSRRILGTVENDKMLQAMALNGEVTELGPTHAAAALGGWPISAVASVLAAASLFGDDFESGDLTLWSEGQALSPPSQDGQ